MFYSISKNILGQSLSQYLGVYRAFSVCALRFWNNLPLALRKLNSIVSFKRRLRRSTSNAIEFLAEKSEKERELKREELAIKKRELDLAETRQDEAAQQQQTMFSALMNQMQQQQQLQQQNLQRIIVRSNLEYPYLDYSDFSIIQTFSLVPILS